MNRPVGLAEMSVSRNPADVLVAYSLGSCLGVTAYDPVARVGGLVHLMLPEASADPDKARTLPCMFVDTGVRLLFEECRRQGAVRGRLQLTAAGGATPQDNAGRDFFQIGRRNFVALRRALWTEGILLEAYEVGGRDARTLSLEIAGGRVTVARQGIRHVLADPLDPRHRCPPRRDEGATEERRAP